jgi:Na+-driven multidrug efflux pump
LSIVIGSSGVLFAEELLNIMGASQNVVAEGRGFAAVSLGGAATILYLFLLNAANLQRSNFFVPSAARNFLRPSAPYSAFPKA